MNRYPTSQTTEHGPGLIFTLLDCPSHNRFNAEKESCDEWNEYILMDRYAIHKHFLHENTIFDVSGAFLNVPYKTFNFIFFYAVRDPGVKWIQGFLEPSFLEYFVYIFLIFILCNLNKCTNVILEELKMFEIRILFPSNLFCEDGKIMLIQLHVLSSAL